MNATLLLLLLPLGSCAIATGWHGNSALLPFAEAGRFVPAGMCSFACERGGQVLDFPSLGMEAAYVVSAGCDFEEPNDLGLGRSRTVWIADLGTASADAVLRRGLREMAVEQDSIEGVPCWHVLPAAKYALAWWCACVDDRFLLTALDRDVLAAALQRSTDLATELGPFGDLAFLPADATDLMFLLPPARVAVDVGPPAPEAPMVFAVQPGPWRITMHSRKRPPDAYVASLRGICESVGAPAADRDGWWRCGGVLRRQVSIHAADGLLTWWTLFGHILYI